MVSQSLNGLEAIHTEARALLKGNGPVRILVCNDAGLPVLDVQRDDLAPAPDPRESALSAELAVQLFQMGGELTGQTVNAGMLRTDEQFLLFHREAPFTLVAFWPSTAQKLVSAPFEEGFASLIEALQEELT